MRDSAEPAAQRTTRTAPSRPETVEPLRRCAAEPLNHRNQTPAHHPMNTFRAQKHALHVFMRADSVYA